MEKYVFMFKEALSDEKCEVFKDTLFLLVFIAYLDEQIERNSFEFDQSKCFATLLCTSRVAEVLATLSDVQAVALAKPRSDCDAEGSVAKAQQLDRFQVLPAQVSAIRRGVDPC